MSENRIVRLATTGMHCGSCAMLIDMTLEDVTGVRSVKTEYASGTTEVTFDPEAVDVDGIVAAVRAIGYDATAL